MAASDYLNEMRRYFENNSRTKDFVAHTAKVGKEGYVFFLYSVIYNDKCGIYSDKIMQFHLLHVCCLRLLKTCDVFLGTFSGVEL